MSAVENQGQCGTCWTFGTFGSLESGLLSLSPAQTWIFSENNLKDLSGFDRDACPCMNTQTPSCNAGGTASMALAYLARWGSPSFQAGPVNAADDPYYSTDNTNTSPSFPPGATVRKHVQDAIVLAARQNSTDNTALKNAIMQYGAVFTTMFAGCEGSSTPSFYTNYDQTTYAYYYSGSPSTCSDGTTIVQNHAVTLAGWNDNFPASNFVTSPPGNGAFLIKNSWGTAANGFPSDGGYFWISYYDAIYAMTAEPWVFWTADPTTNYTRQYEYDPLGWVNNLGYGSTTAWYANVWQAAATEQLQSVSTYAASNGSQYVISVYTGVGSSGPTSGTLVSSATTGGTFQLAGYHTVPLASPVPLTQGQSFSVVVELTTPNLNFPIPDHYGIAGYSSKAPLMSPGQSYISNNGTTWTDTTTISTSVYGGIAGTLSVALKAFTGSPTLTVSKTGTGSGTVTSTSPDSQINCGSSCSGQYASGTSVTLSAQAASGSTFTSWSGCTSTSGTTCTVTMPSNATTVTATFTANPTTYTLTVSKTGTGSGAVTSTSPDTQINCGSSCSGNYASGTSVTLSAQPASGSIFTSWSGCTPTSSTPCTVTVNSNPTTVTATFTASGSTAPVLTSLSPSSAVAGGGGFDLTVNGSNFVYGSTVLWNNISCPTTFQSSTQLKVQASTIATYVGVAGTASVTVSNPSGGGVSNALTFDILEAFTGSGGYLSMFVNGANLGNSALFQSGGLVGLGTTSPIRTLDVNGEIQARGGNLFLQRNMTDYPDRRNWAWGTETANRGDMAFFVSTTNTGFPSVNVMTLLSNGNVGIGPIATTPSTTLQVGGDIRVGTSGSNGCLQNFSGGTIMGTCSSDARLKTNILPFAPILDKLVKLQPVHFDWNTQQYPDYHFGAGRNSGLLAQDVETVFPEMVGVDAHGYKTVNYSELPYLTLAAIRELKIESDYLRAQLSERKAENDSLRAQLAERQKELEELRQEVEARLARLEKPPSHRTKKKTAVHPQPAAGAKARSSGAR
jgi:C1A family cysteine protease